MLELEPDNIDAHFQLAELARRENNLTAALGHFDIVLRLDATFPGCPQASGDDAAELPRRGCASSRRCVRELLDAEIKDVDQGGSVRVAPGIRADRASGAFLP